MGPYIFKVTRSGVELDLLGQRLRIRTDASPDLLQQASELVSRRLEEVSRGGHKGSALTTALIACLNLAGDCLKLSRESERGRVEMKDRLERLVRSIEGELERSEEFVGHKKRLIAL